MSSHTMRKLIPLCILCVAVGLLLWVLSENRQSTHVDRTVPELLPQSDKGLEATSSSLEPFAASGRILIVPASSPNGVQLDEPIVGRVVDGASGEPLAATITVGDERFGTTASGSFAISHQETGSTARFEAFGFVARSVVIDGSSAMTVALHPAGVVRVRVETADGAPLSGTTVDFVAAEWPRDEARPVLASVSTDDTGRAEFASSVTRVALLADHPGIGAQVRPGETRTIVVGRPSSGLRFLDLDTHEPVAGVRVRVHRSGTDRLAARVLETSEAGDVALTVSESGHEVELMDEHVAWSRPLPASVTERVRGGVHVSATGETGEPTILFVHVERATLMLHDASTGLPIDAVIEATVTYADRSEPIPPGFYKSFVVRDGRFPLQRFDSSARADPRLWCAIRPPGYVMTDVPDLSRVYLSAPEPLRVDLEPAVRRRLRFVDTTGTPFTSGVYVSDHEWLRDFYFGRPDDLDGIVEVDWGGGDLVVWRPSRNADRGSSNGRTLLARVSGSLLEQQEEVLVVIDDEARGEVVVMGVPAGVAVHAIGVGGRHAIAIAGSDGRVELGAFSPGRLLVGTKPWVDHNQENFRIGHFPDALQVAPRRTLRVAYEKRWTLDSPIEGRIALDAITRAHAVVLPEYTTQPGKAPPSRPRLEIGLDDAGRYTIPAGDPLPERLAVWVANQLDPERGPLHGRYLAAWADAGAESVPSLGTLEVVLPSDSTLDRVEIEWTYRDARVGLDKTARAELERGESLHLPGLPQGPVRLLCTANGRDWTERANVGAGSVSVLRVEQE